MRTWVGIRNTQVKAGHGVTAVPGYKKGSDRCFLERSNTQKISWRATGDTQRQPQASTRTCAGMHTPTYMCTHKIKWKQNNINRTSKEEESPPWVGQTPPANPLVLKQIQLWQWTDGGIRPARGCAWRPPWWKSWEQAAKDAGQPDMELRRQSYRDCRLSSLPILSPKTTMHIRTNHSLLL